MKFAQLAKSTIDELKLSLIRFPFSVLCALTLFFFALDNIYHWDILPNEKEDRVFSSLVAGFFWFGGAKLFAESRKLPIILYSIISIIGFIILSAYIYYGHYGMAVYNFIISGLIVFVTVAPFLKRGSKDSGFYNFNREMWIGFIYAFILSILFCAGISAIVATIHELFGLDVGHKIYSVIWSFGSLFLAPYYALSWVSRDFNSKQESYVPKGVNFILTYILVPLGLIYLGILYAYAIKILIEWKLPVGKLSYMICGFGAIGSFVQIAAHPLRENGGYLVKLFHRYFCRAFLPLIFLLFLAIGVRIHDYGITESRYAITLAGVWFAITTIIYIFRRDDETMKFGPAILAAMLILASFGPWGAVKLSETSQVARLESILKENKVLVNDKITKTDTLVSLDDRISITSIVDYLAKTDKLDAIKPWFSKETNIYTKEGRYIGNDIVQDLGLEPATSWNRHYDNNYFDFSNYSDTEFLLEVKGYDYLTDTIYARSIDDWEACKPNCTQSILAILDDNKLTIKFEDGGKLAFDLNPLIEELGKALPNDQGKKMVLSAENAQYKAKIMLSNISGTHDLQKDKINSVSLTVLYKKK
jgi:hypothetical protein